MSRPVFFNCQVVSKTVFINLDDISRVEVEDGQVTIFLRGGWHVTVEDKTEARALLRLLEQTSEAKP